MLKISRQEGFTITEMMISTGIMMIIVGGALTTFKNALAINETASQLADSNQNLRAGTNQLIRDVMMAGRIIGAEGIAMPTGPGILFKRPGPVNLNFDLVADTDATLQLPSISTGFRLGPTINGSQTDMITILTVDEFMPVVTTPPVISTAPTVTEGTISADGTTVRFSNTAQWMIGDTVGDTPKIKPGDLVLFKGQFGNAIQTVTSVTTTTMTFAVADVNDFFQFNQSNAVSQLPGTGRPLAAVKQITVPATVLQSSTLCPALPNPPGGTAMSVASNFCSPVTLFKVLMITYYVDNTTVAYPGLTCPPSCTPRLMRAVNHFTPQALAGVVEDLDLTYDVYDGVTNPTNLTTLPVLISGVTYSSSQIRKVNLHVGVRSETISKPTQDYVRNHITTSVNVRSLAAVDRYVSQ